MGIKRIFYPLLFISLLFVLYLTVRSTFFTEEDYKVLFVLSDAGETMALIPLMDRLEANRINYRALVMSTARNIIENKKYVVDINTRCGVVPFIDREKWKKEDSVPDSEIVKIKKCVDSEIIITGMNTRIQQQIASSFKKDGANVIAYYDLFSMPNDDSISMQFLNNVNEVWTSIGMVKDKFRVKRKDLRIEAVGQPIIARWIDTAESINKEDFRKKIGVSNSLPLILYAGGNGDDYAASFEMFARVAKNFAGKYNVIVSLHPKSDGATEKQILIRNNASNVIIIPKSITTIDATASSDILVCHRSTVGITALFAKKPVIYLDERPSGYSNFIIEAGWAPQVGNVDDFIKIFNQKINIKTFDINTDDIYQRAGISMDSVGVMYEILSKKL